MTRTRTIAANEAQNSFGSLLDLVEQGEQIVITRHGKPVARLVSLGCHIDREAARQAATRIREGAKGVTLGGMSIKGLLGEGRT